MEVRKQRIVVYCLAGILFVVGVVSYAAFPVKTPEEPFRIIFKSSAGNIMFDHKEHTSESGYDIGCSDCHHNIEEEGERPPACGECHEVDGEDPVKRSEAFHMNCIACHEEEEAGPVECSGCHVR